MARNLYELQGRADKRLSPFCWRTRMALWHKGLEAEFIPVQFGQKDKIAFSGQKLVPVLEDNERVIHDSWTIACYLEEPIGIARVFSAAPPGAPARALSMAGSIAPSIRRCCAWC